MEAAAEDDNDSGATTTSTPTTTSSETDKNEGVLEAATSEPAKVVDLISEGANAYAVSDEGECLLRLLVANDDTTEDILTKVLEHMKEHPHDSGDEARRSALAKALELHSMDLAKVLLRSGATITKGSLEECWPLVQAAWDEDEDLISLLLDAGADANEQDDKGYSALDNACRLGNAPIARKLLDRDDIRIEISDNEGWSPLKTAAEYGKTELVSLLLSRGANVDSADNGGRTPLLSASQEGHDIIVSSLIQNGADINKADNEGWTPLLTAISNRHENIVSILLDKKADVNKADNEGWTPLHAAVFKGDKKTVSTLLDRGAHFKRADNIGRTPLLVASQFGHREIVQTLVDMKADVQHKNNEGWTPLLMASRYGHAEIVRLLLEHKAQAHTCIGQGYTPIYSASKWGHHGVLEQLLGCQPLIDLDIMEEGRTALHWASYHGHTENVSLLLRNGADKNKLDKDGCTALHLASQQGYSDVIQKLLDNQASVNDPDNNGWTALHKVSFHNDTSEDRLDYEDTVIPEHYKNLRPDHQQVIELLLEKGADPLKQTNEGDTPLHLAAKRTDMNASAIRSLLKRIETTDFCTKPLEREILLWAAQNRETHDIVAILAQKGTSLARKDISPQYSECALCWAAYNADSTLVRKLLYSSPLDSVTYRERKLAEEVIRPLIAKDTKQTVQRGGEPDPKAPTIKDTDQRVKKGQIDKPRKDQGTSTGKYKDILDLLHNPPVVKTTVPSAPCKMPVPGPGTAIEGFEAAVVDFYANKDFSGFLRRLRAVKEVIYDKEQGPDKLMTAARETMETEQRAIECDSCDTVADNMFSSDDFKFRWIHLPANSMQWMKDLLSRIYVEKTTEDRDAVYGDLEKFFRRTWRQVPDTTSQYRFMKPGLSMQSKRKNNQEQGKGKDSQETPIAIYMPYLAFAAYPSDPASKYNSLLRDYKTSAIHGFRTLDESYYRFTTHNGDERARRNKDQVVTRIIHKHSDQDPLGKTWMLAGVEQLWVWIIDSKTIITSSTHRGDNGPNRVWLHVLDKLSELRNGENTRSQPQTPQELSRFIVDTCTRFYEEMKCSPDSSESRVYQKAPWSIQQYYAHAVDQAAVEEAELFDKFAHNELTGSIKRHRQERLASERDEYISKTASLLCQVKDIRDELNMLKAIATEQEKVQRELGEQQGSAKNIIQDLREMDRATDRIYEAVNATLTFEQNVIALTQSDETVQQGRVIMGFTIATIIFLPMSFLVSLFAVDITVFQHNSSGDLQYTPGWIFPIIFGVSAAVSVPMILIFLRSSIFGPAKPLGPGGPIARAINEMTKSATVLVKKKPPPKMKDISWRSPKRTALPDEEAQKDSLARFRSTANHVHLDVKAKEEVTLVS